MTVLESAGQILVGQFEQPGGNQLAIVDHDSGRVWMYDRLPQDGRAVAPLTLTSSPLPVLMTDFNGDCQQDLLVFDGLQGSVSAFSLGSDGFNSLWTTSALFAEPIVAWELIDRSPALAGMTWGLPTDYKDRLDSWTPAYRYPAYGGEIAGSYSFSAVAGRADFEFVVYGETSDRPFSVRGYDYSICGPSLPGSPLDEGDHPPGANERSSRGPDGQNSGKEEFGNGEEGDSKLFWFPPRSRQRDTDLDEPQGVSAGGTQGVSGPREGTESDLDAARKRTEEINKRLAEVIEQMNDQRKRKTGPTPPGPTPPGPTPPRPGVDVSIPPGPTGGPTDGPDIPPGENDTVGGLRKEHVTDVGQSWSEPFKTVGAAVVKSVDWVMARLETLWDGDRRWDSLTWPAAGTATAAAAIGVYLLAHSAHKKTRKRRQHRQRRWESPPAGTAADRPEMMQRQPKLVEFPQRFVRT